MVNPYHVANFAFIIALALLAGWMAKLLMREHL